MKTRIFINTLVLILLLAACAPQAVTTAPPPILTEEPPLASAAVVEHVEVQVVKNSPVRVNVIVRGRLPDAGCTSIASIEQERDEKVIRLRLVTTTDPLALCAYALTPFEHVVALDVRGLEPGEFLVEVHGNEASFEFPAPDAGEFQQLLVEALNARDFERLESMMDESFTIAYWRSEGVAYAPELAVEQLRLNLLSSSEPVIPDLSRNLVEILGVDPVTIAGPDFVEVEALFVSGFGEEGRDEAILFIAKRPEGSPHWYGLLFAKDGFAK